MDETAELKDKYIISRDGNNRKQDVYRSLSEGEKTLITFLYFLECCKGKTNENDTDMRDKLIVIDNPAIKFISKLCFRHSIHNPS
ncbi:AAA family ATPase [Escherichia coli]